MSRYGKPWTVEDIVELSKLRKVELLREQTLCKKLGVPMGTLNIETKPSKKKQLLNKTESLWKVELERRRHKIILAQALTFRLGDRLTYRPDLVTVDAIETTGGAFYKHTCWECKAPHRFKQAGITKLKAAAKQYPWIRFVLVMRDKGKFTEREIGCE